MSYYVLKAFSLTGWVSELRQPPLALLEAKRIKRTSKPAVAQTAPGKPVPQAV